MSVLAKVYGDHAITVNSVGKYKAYMKVVRAAVLTFALVISTVHCTSFGSDFQGWAEEKRIEFVLAMLSMFVGLVGINHFCS